MRIYIDGMPLDNPTDALLNPNFIFQRIDDTGDRAFSYTGDLVFTGADALYIKSKLIDDPNALENKVILRFEDDCCGDPLLIYEFFITGQTAQWCESTCDITASATEKSIANDQFTCMKNTMIWDNYAGFKNRVHPRMSYCNELRPDFMQHFTIVVTLALYTAFLTMGPILIVIAAIIYLLNALIPVVNSVINAINSLGFSIGTINLIDLDNDPGTNAFQEFDNWVQKLINLGVGCGRKHPSPLLREYIKNFCGKCGLSFSSSILNDPTSDYWNTVYVNAPVHKGVEEADTTTYWIEENQPILNGIQLMDQLVPTFNAKYEVQNSILSFERRDHFVPKTPFIDLTTDPDVLDVCWQWSKKNRYSYAELKYQQDAINQVGNEAIPRWGDVIEWNNPYSSLQKGPYKPLIPFAACRYRDDGIDRDILTFYNTQPTISNVINRYRNSMIMNSHYSFLPMLMIWDGDENANAFADKFINKNYLAPSLGVGINQMYNYPYWFREGAPGNLYTNFHYIENPRLSGFQGFDFTARVKISCRLLRALDVDGVVHTARGDSQNDNTQALIINIDRVNGIVTIKGTV